MKTQKHKVEHKKKTSKGQQTMKTQFRFSKVTNVRGVVASHNEKLRCFERVFKSIKL